MQHIERVYNNAVAIAKELNLGDRDVEIVQLAALLHDVSDYKYASEQSAQQVSVSGILRSFGYDEGGVNDITFIIDSMSFSSELKGSAGPADARLKLLLGVVQDADRLDAIGAIGVARCLTYGGAKKRVLHDPSVAPRVDLTAEGYMATSAGTGTGTGAGGEEGKVQEQTTINHFYEKLLKLSGLMKTAPGKRMAAGRHAFLLSFLDQFHEEWAGRR